MDFPAFNNHTKKAKVQIFEASFLRLIQKEYFDEMIFKNIRPLYKIGRSFSGNMFSFSHKFNRTEADEISVASPRFEVEDHGEINFVHKSANKALENIIKIVFGKRVLEGQGDGFFDLVWSR